MPGPDGWDDEAADADAAGGVPFRPLSVSEMLDGAIAGIRRRPRTTLGLSVAVSTVIQVASSIAAYFFIGAEARDEVTPDLLLESLGAQATLAFLGLLLSAFGILLMSGLMAPILGRELVGLPVPRGRVWRDVRPRLGRLVLVSAAVLGISLGALLVPLVPFLLAVAADARPAAGLAAGMLGAPVGLVLMVWLYVRFVQAVPAVVLERRTVGGALRRAAILGKGHWFRTFGTLVTALLVTVFMGLFALRVPFLFVQLVLFGDASGSGATMGALAVDTLGRIVSWSVVLPFDAGVIALVYIDRRMRGEGFDLDLRTRGRSAADIAAGERARAGAGDDGADAADGADGGEDGFIGLWRPREAPREAPQQASQQAPQHPWTGVSP